MKGKNTKSGAKVVIADINKEIGNIVADQIKKDNGEALFVETNVADFSSVDNMVSQTLFFGY